ncbi:uncharacterized protein NPIL_482351 [Nephila pilipes]|uniref:Uncharacterized protein n=1 Tax=Nephila pilipes TaxID=299642 RepID=A0A8X6M9R8_NEPPI|nr:uncharacterized protein NPIL_482351 [Nephila pilipes]
MSQKKVFKTTEEAVEYIFLEELESEMIVLPPEVDEFTDEEGFDDSETLDLSVKDIICPIIYDDNTPYVGSLSDSVKDGGLAHTTESSLNTMINIDHYTADVLTAEGYSYGVIRNADK